MIRYTIIFLGILGMASCWRDTPCSEVYEYIFDSPDVILLKPIVYDQYIEDIYNKFHDDIKLIQHIVISVEEKCSGIDGLIDAARTMKENTVIINLYIRDFYETYSTRKDLRDEIIYAGDSEKVTENVTVIDENGHAMVKEVDIAVATKIASANINKHASLLNYLYNFPNGAYSPDIEEAPKTVLICDTYVDNHFNLNTIVSSDCGNDVEKYNDHLLAVISSKPFETDVNIIAPIIYYDSPLLEYRAENKNEITLINSWMDLDAVFMHVLKKKNWRRVAVLSDSSYYSELFNAELIKSFEKEGIAYASEMCHESDEGIDFLKALKKLKNANTKIIILNIDDRNTRTFIQQVEHMRMNDKQITWLVRDNPFKENFFDNPRNFFSISFSVDNFYPILDYVDDKLNLCEKYIKNADISVKRKKFHNCVTKELSEKIKQMENYAYIRKIQSSRTSTVATFEFIHTAVHSVFGHWDIPGQDLNDCLIRTENFFKPCGDLDVVYIMLMVLVFSMVIMALVVCLTDDAVTRLVYRNFR